MSYQDTQPKTAFRDVYGNNNVLMALEEATNLPYDIIRHINEILNGEKLHNKRRILENCHTTLDHPIGYQSYLVYKDVAERVLGVVINDGKDGLDIQIRADYAMGDITHSNYEIILDTPTISSKYLFTFDLKETEELCKFEDILRKLDEIAIKKKVYERHGRKRMLKRKRGKKVMVCPNGCIKHRTVHLKEYDDGEVTVHCLDFKCMH